jgi:excisionase family DNA binding protein
MKKPRRVLEHPAGAVTPNPLGGAMHVDRTRMYRVSAVAKALDVSPSTVYRAIESGDLDALRIGSAVRIRGTALAAWLHRCANDGHEHDVLAGESGVDLDAVENATENGEVAAP